MATLSACPNPPKWKFESPEKYRVQVVFLQRAIPQSKLIISRVSPKRFHVEGQELLPMWGAPIMTDETIIRFTAAQASTWFHQQDSLNEDDAKERGWKE